MMRAGAKIMSSGHRYITQYSKEENGPVSPWKIVLMQITRHVNTRRKTDRSSLNEQVLCCCCFISSREHDVVNRRCMIGTVAGHHLLCLSIGTQSIIGRLCSASGDWAKKGEWRYLRSPWCTRDVTWRDVTSLVESFNIGRPMANTWRLQIVYPQFSHFNFVFIRSPVSRIEGNWNFPWCCVYQKRKELMSIGLLWNFLIFYSYTKF